MFRNDLSLGHTYWLANHTCYMHSLKDMLNKLYSKRSTLTFNINQCFKYDDQKAGQLKNGLNLQIAVIKLKKNL